MFLYDNRAIRLLAMLISTTTSANTSTISMLATGSSIVSSFAHLITVKLMTKENYPLWRAQFLPYLRSNILLGIVDDTVKAPPETITKTTAGGAVQEISPDFLTWYSQDQAILGAQLTSLSESVLGQVVLCKTSHEVWSTLSTNYSGASQAISLNTRVQLATLKKGGLSATEYFNKMKALADTLAIIDQPLKDEEFIAYLLAGLDESYDSLVTSVTNRYDTIPLSGLFTYLLSQESRIEPRQTAPKADEYSANFVDRGRGRVPMRGSRSGRMSPGG
jgi:hypothetical protein